jgi:hypothetical protein
MGYRSDVTIMMYPKNEKDFAALKLYVDETCPMSSRSLGGRGDKYLLLEFDGIKWYEGYEEVDVYTRAFSEWEDTFRDEADPEGRGDLSLRVHADRRGLRGRSVRL